MDDRQFQSLIKVITQDQTPRVWSLLVTVFGELGQDAQVKISGALLGHMTESIGVKPEALRVALHRLRKDGWIESAKSGRSSSHFLSARGREESAKANPIIYMERPAPVRAWLLIQDGPLAPGADQIALGAHQVIGLEHSAAPDCLSLPLTADMHIPDWIRARICDSGLCRQSIELEQRLTELHSALPRNGALSPMQAAIMRVLIIHDWRRLILKAPNLPGYLFPDAWRGEACKALITRVLGALGQQDISAIERDMAA